MPAGENETAAARQKRIGKPERCACCTMSLNSPLAGKTGGGGAPLCQRCRDAFPNCDWHPKGH